MEPYKEVLSEYGNLMDMEKMRDDNILIGKGFVIFCLQIQVLYLFLWH